MERPVNDTEKELLKHKRHSYKFSLTDQLSIMQIDVVHGLTDTVIDSIVEKSSILFTNDDIVSHMVL